MPDRSGPRTADLLAYLAGVVLLAGALTVAWRSMRAVMDIGGTCASGGPYVVAVECPQGIEWLLPLSILVGIGGAAMVGWFGGRIGPGFGALVLLAWPALFLSLGWNFLEYAFSSPGGWDVAWLVCGVLFVAMGGIPLVIGLRALRPRPTTGAARPRPWAGAARPGRGTATAQPRAMPESPTTSRHAQLAGLLRQVQTIAVTDANRMTVGEATGLEPPPAGVVDQLERLAALKERGALGELEYLQAKQAVLDAASRDGAA